MNRYDYLETLDRSLTSLPYNERREIMYDYEEHFKEGLKDGNTEEQIIASLGAPDKVASQYTTSLVNIMPEPNSEHTTPLRQPIKKNGNNLGEIVALSIIMLLFNSIFIAFYVAFWGLLITFVTLGAALLITGLFLLISALLQHPLHFFQYPLYFFNIPS